MRLTILGMAISALAQTGCTHMALERHTVRQAATITDVRYQQVMNNLALMARTPSAMPHYALVTGGLAQVDDNVSGTGSLMWGWMGGDMGSSSTSQMLGGTAQRTKSGNWSLDPLHEPERITAMRCVYQKVLGSEPKCGECDEYVRLFKLEADLAKMPTGWFCVGTKRDVPKHACYVANYHDTYVWVLPEGVEGLTRLSLIILDIATVEMSSLYPTKTVVTKYDGNCVRVGVEVTSEVDASQPDCVKNGTAVPVTTAPIGPAIKRRRDAVPSVRSLIGPARSR